MTIDQLKQEFLTLRTTVKPRQTLKDIFDSTMTLLEQFCEERTSVPFTVLELLYLPAPSYKTLVKEHVRTKRTDIIDKYTTLLAPYIGTVKKFEAKHPDILYLAHETNFYSWLFGAFGSATNPVTPPSQDVPEDDPRRAYFHFVESIYNDKVITSILKDGNTFSYLPPNICENLAKESPEFFKQFYKDSREYLKSIGYKAAKKKVSSLIKKRTIEINRLAPYEINRWTHIRVGNRWVEITYNCE